MCVDFYIRVLRLQNFNIGDRASKCNTIFWKHLVEQWKIKLAMSPADHQKLNGQTEIGIAIL
jgi:uncharacterized protein YijF (DUF1287 family)